MFGAALQLIKTGVMALFKGGAKATVKAGTTAAAKAGTKAGARTGAKQAATGAAKTTSKTKISPSGSKPPPNPATGATPAGDPIKAITSRMSGDARKVLDSRRISLSDKVSTVQAQVRAGNISADDAAKVLGSKFQSMAKAGKLSREEAGRIMAGKNIDPKIIDALDDAMATQAAGARTLAGRAGQAFRGATGSPGKIAAAGGKLLLSGGMAVAAPVAKPALILGGAAAGAHAFAFGPDKTLGIIGDGLGSVAEWAGERLYNNTLGWFIGDWGESDRPSGAETGTMTNPGSDGGATAGPSSNGSIQTDPSTWIGDITERIADQFEGSWLDGIWSSNIMNIGRGMLQSGFNALSNINLKSEMTENIVMLGGAALAFLFGSRLLDGGVMGTLLGGLLAVGLLMFGKDAWNGITGKGAPVVAQGTGNNVPRLVVDNTKATTGHDNDNLSEDMKLAAGYGQNTPAGLDTTAPNGPRGPLPTLEAA